MGQQPLTSFIIITACETGLISEVLCRVSKMLSFWEVRLSHCGLWDKICLCTMCASQLIVSHFFPQLECLNKQCNENFMLFLRLNDKQLLYVTVSDLTTIRCFFILTSLSNRIVIPQRILKIFR